MNRCCPSGVCWGIALSSSLSVSEQQQIQQWVAAHGTPQQADGQSDVAIAQQLSINRKTVILWRQRFSEQSLDGLWEIAPGRGRKPNYDTDKIAAIVDATLQTKPEGMTHWSCRTMARSQGVSKSTINNIWQARSKRAAVGLATSAAEMVTLSWTRLTIVSSPLVNTTTSATAPQLYSPPWRSYKGK